MTNVIRCLGCGIDNRIPEIEPGRRGVFRCGACRQPIKFYAPSLEEEEKLVVDEDDREISRVLTALCWTTTILLLLMFADWAEPYYDVARLFVFTSSALGLFLAMHDREHRWPWFFMLGGLAILYAPLMRLVFDRVPWIMIDCGAAVVLGFAPLYCQVPRKLREALEMTQSEAIRHLDRIH